MDRPINKRVFWTAIATISIVWMSCRRSGTLPMSMDTLQPLNDSFSVVSKPDTSHTATDTAQPSLPPMAKAIDPAKLQTFLPNLPGWSPQGDIERELQVRDNFNRSRVTAHYASGPKTLKIQIDDFAYVPSLYAPWTQFKGNYLEDNNDERTETTTLNGYHAVQSTMKKQSHAEMTVFPGNRYVVTIQEDGTSDVNEVRQIAQAMNLKGLETLQ